jgi:hypothetical protein
MCSIIIFIPEIMSKHSAEVIVWEWEDEFQRWRPYAPKVSNGIEKVFQKWDPKGRLSNILNQDVSLKQFDQSLSMYEIDFKSMLQKNIFSSECCVLVFLIIFPFLLGSKSYLD